MKSHRGEPINERAILVNPVTVGQKGVAFFVLVVLQCLLLIVVKLAANEAKDTHSSTAFRFSPPAALAVAELLKLLMSAAAILRAEELKTNGIVDVRRLRTMFSHHVNLRLCITYGSLGLAYAFNNDITFVLSTMADPGSIAHSRRC
jgi:hypothetical protein